VSAPCFAQVDPALLAHVDVPAVVPALPVMVLSLVYHSVVPTVCYQLGCDLSRIRTALLLGSALPCLMFIAWSAVILGSVPYDAAAAASASGATFDPLAVLRASGDSFGSTVRLFSLLAVCTSFVGFYYGLTDFFADVLGFDTKGVGSSDGGEQNMAVLEPKVAKKALAVREEEEEEEKGQEEAAAPITALRTPGEKALLGAPTTALRTPGEKALLGALTLLPPLGFAVGDPSIFFSALDNGGTYGVMTLFGILPAAMAWAQRYGEGRDPDTAFAEEALPGGKLTLLAMIAAGAAFVSVETWERIEALT
jgi:hypothetical protein